MPDPHRRDQRICISHRHKREDMHSTQSSTARSPPRVCPGRQTERVEGNTYYANFTNRWRHHAACRTKEGATMKKLMVLLLAGCLVVLSPGFSKGAADDEGDDSSGGGQIPLSALAGTYAVTLQGPLVLCFENAPPFSNAKCGSMGSIAVSFSIIQVGAVTRDAAGNGCATVTQSYTDLPVDTSPPFVAVGVHNVSKIPSYDPTTGTGDNSVTSYSGGQCHGATFDSTGATAQSTSTAHFAASDHGKRIDGVVTS